MTRTRLASVAAVIGLGIASSADAACVFGKVAEFPVTMRGLRATITTKINGRDAIFIIDSGAFYSMISEEAAARFGMKATMAPAGMRIRGVGGGSAAAQVARAQEFTLGGTPYKNVEFLLGARVGGEGGIVGLLGQNILGSMDVEYDLANGYLRFFQAKGCGDSNLAYWSAGKSLSRLPLKGGDGPVLMKVKTTAQVDGHTINVSWDSGSSLSVLSTPAARRAGVRPTSDNVVPAGIAYGVFGRGMETSLAPFGAFVIGDEQIKNTRLRVADIELSDSDMLLGMDFFLSHRVLVSRSQDKVYFTYNGGPVFRLDSETRQARAAAPEASATPSLGGPQTAADYSLRGSASLARRDIAAAVADFTKAIQLEPKEARHYKDRAQARLAGREPILAMADLAEALKLKPDDVDALMTRGALYLGARDEVRARADFEAVKAQAPGDTRLSMRIGQTYNAAGHYQAAVAEYDRWLAAHPNDDAAPRVLNERCWSRGLWGQQLEAGLTDCDAALKRGGRNSSFMDSRGLVLLRMGRLDEAIGQYDAALKLQPKQPWSLYGRGLAKLRRGDKPGGEADIAAATAIQPDIAAEAKRRGITADDKT